MAKSQPNQGAISASGRTRDPGAEQAERLVREVALGRDEAFTHLYDLLSSRVYGLVLRVLRDPAQSEEVAQEVFVELWRSAARYEPGRGSVAGWALTIAHRRAVDRVRSAQSSSDREERVGAASQDRPFDQVSDEVIGRFEHEQVRRCVDSLTDAQRESVSLAYYQGHTYRDVARILGAPLGTIKTRMRDGLIRLRDCLGVAW